MTLALVQTTETLTIVSDATATTDEPEYVADISHIGPTNDVERSHMHAGALTGTTPVTVVDAPDPDIEKRVDIKSISVHNKDTVSHDITVGFKVGATTYIVWAGTLTTEQTWYYAHDGSMGII